jgi:hypothetical protein
MICPSCGRTMAYEWKSKTELIYLCYYCGAWQPMPNPRTDEHPTPACALPGFVTLIPGGGK